MLISHTPIRNTTTIILHAIPLTAISQHGLIPFLFLSVQHTIKCTRLGRRYVNSSRHLKLYSNVQKCEHACHNQVTTSTASLKSVFIHNKPSHLNSQRSLAIYLEYMSTTQKVCVSRPAQKNNLPRISQSNSYHSQKP